MPRHNVKKQKKILFPQRFAYSISEIGLQAHEFIFTIWAVILVEQKMGAPKATVAFGPPKQPLLWGPLFFVPYTRGLILMKIKYAPIVQL